MIILILPLILSLIIGGLFFSIFGINTKALEKETETQYIYPEIPTVNVVEENKILYMKNDDLACGAM